MVALQDFLAAVSGTLPVLIRWYWDLLDRKARRNLPRAADPGRINTVADFIEALRINPAVQFPHVRVLRVDEIQSDTPHDSSRSGPPGGSYEKLGSNEKISPREILCTYSDEPDWGMDQDLFEIGRYGYGPCPFGPKTGQSSQAPFHMAFTSENRLVSALFPGLKRSFVEERVRVSYGLARLAFGTGMDYWGWRFTGWAMHYLQDITQPYHAKALPFPILPVLRRMVRERGLRTFAERNKNLLRNRHMMFEAVVHFLLNDAAKRYSTHELLLALAEEGNANIGTIRTVIVQCAHTAAHLARRADRAVSELMRDPRVDDPNYFMGDDHSYRVDEKVPEARVLRPARFDALMELLCEMLVHTGRVTRYAVRRVEDSKASW
ncbi:hypothetical protein ACFL2Q_08035 [Thermodesulfobacteriota bacterium]